MSVCVSVCLSACVTVAERSAYTSGSQTMGPDSLVGSRAMFWWVSERPPSLQKYINNFACYKINT